MKSKNTKDYPPVNNRIRRKKPLVSVITVCLNSEETIKRTIESVLHQTYGIIEYIIIDGESTDRTIDIIKQYESKFKGRMRWISEKDAGIYDAMNKGITLAQGELIGIINSDDWYESNTLQLVVDAYKEHHDAVYYGILRYWENKKEVMLNLINYQFLYREHVGHPAYFVTKYLYKKHGKFRVDYKYASDYELMLRLIRSKIKFVQINNILANYCFGGKSSKYGLKTYDEFLRLRYEYGYLTKSGMWLRIFKNRILSVFKNIGAGRKLENG